MRCIERDVASRFLRSRLIENAPELGQRAASGGKSALLPHAKDRGRLRFRVHRPPAQQLFDAIGKFPQTPRKRRIGNVITMRLPGVAKVDEFWVKPVFSPPCRKSSEKPLLEAPGDDPGRTVRGVVARSEDRTTAVRQTIGQVDADGLEVGIAQLKPALRLNDQIGNPWRTESWGRSRRSDGSAGRPE